MSPLSCPMKISAISQHGLLPPYTLHAPAFGDTSSSSSTPGCIHSLQSLYKTSYGDLVSLWALEPARSVPSQRSSFWFSPAAHLGLLIILTKVEQWLPGSLGKVPEVGWTIVTMYGSCFLDKVSLMLPRVAWNLLRRPGCP